MHDYGTAINICIITYVDKKKRRRSALGGINEEMHGRATFETLDPQISVEPFVPNIISHNRGKRSSHCPGEERYMLFIWDLSGSISKAKFIEMKGILKNIVYALCGHIKVAMLTYSNVVNVEFCFNCYNNDRNQIARAIDRVAYIGDLTHTAHATKCACDYMLSTTCGWNSSLLDTDVMYVTDGKHNGPCSDRLTDTIQCLHNTAKPNVATYAVAYGEKQDLLQLNETGLDILVKGARDSHIFYVDRQSLLQLQERANEAYLLTKYSQSDCLTETRVPQSRCS